MDLQAALSESAVRHGAPQDVPWSTVNDEPEPYALCVSIADRADAQSHLDEQVQALLRARAEQRAQGYEQALWSGVSHRIKWPVFAGARIAASDAAWTFNTERN